MRHASEQVLAMLVAALFAVGCSNSNMLGDGKASRKKDDGKNNRPDGEGDGGPDSGNDGPDSGGPDSGGPDSGNDGPDSGGPDSGGPDSGGPDGGNDSGNDGGDDKDDKDLGVTTDNTGLVIVTEGGELSAFAPKFGLLVNDLECGLCHVKVNGDVASTSDVGGMWRDTKASITGTWFAAKGYNPSAPNGARPDVGQNVNIAVSGGVQPNLKVNASLPKDLNGDGFADFPMIDFNAIAAKMNGSVKADGVTISKVKDGNVTLIGTAENPIVVSGEVLVKGDVVIKGWYKGIGNIYATGNIYIPADLRAKNSPFPYAADPETARKQGRDAIKARKDALALATKMSILISDLEDHGDNNHSVYTHPATPAGRDAAGLQVEHVYSWFKDGKAGYDKLYETNPIECDSGKPRNGRSISEIDAFLYAQNTVGGRANRNSYAINGGVIADHFHIIGASKNCGAGTHPVFKLDQQWSYVNYDWRMQGGLLLLKQLFPYFKP